MNKTLDKIVSISGELAPLVKICRKLEGLSLKLFNEEALEDQEIENLIEKKRAYIRSIVEEMHNLSQLYLTLTTPFDYDPENEDEVKKEEVELKLKELYRELRELQDIGPDPEVGGYDRSFEAEVARREEQIEALEELL